MRSPPDHLWQRNNNVRQSPLAEGQDRLTLPENWGQIGAGRRNFGNLFRVGALWKWHRCAAHRGLREQRKAAPVAICRGAIAIVFGLMLAVAATSPPARAASIALAPSPTPTPTPTPYANSDANSDTDAIANQYQFRPVGRRDRDQSRQQFPGAARKPGVIRVRARVADQSGRRRRFRGNRHPAVSDLGRSLRNLGQYRRGVRFRRRPPSDLGRRRRVRRDALRPASISAFRSTRAVPRSTFRWRCSRRPSISPSSASTPRSTRGRGPGRSRWSTVSARSIRAGTPGSASPAPTTMPGSTAR